MIECRVKSSGIPWALAGQRGVSCDINNGLQCRNKDQANGLCEDYEVSVYCWDSSCE